jgi:hypothetical protein
LPGPYLAVQALVPLTPAQAYRPVNVQEETSWCLTLTVPIPGLGKVRTIGDACRQQGRALPQQLLVFVYDQLSQGAPIERVFAQVFAKQRGLVPV